MEERYAGGHHAQAVEEEILRHHLLHHHLLRRLILHHHLLLLVTAIFVVPLVCHAVAIVLPVDSLANEAASKKGFCAGSIFGKSLRGFYEDLQLQQMRVTRIGSAAIIVL
jgi:hypothetical protein